MTCKAHDVTLMAVCLQWTFELDETGPIFPGTVTPIVLLSTMFLTCFTIVLFRANFIVHTFSFIFYLYILEESTTLYFTLYCHCVTLYAVAFLHALYKIVQDIFW